MTSVRRVRAGGSSRALWRQVLALSLLGLVVPLGCGPASEVPLGNHSIKSPMRPISTDPRVAKVIGRRALDEIGYEQIIGVAVEAGWLRYPEQPSTGNLFGQAAAAPGFWPVFTPYAVAAGVTSQADSPAPGPGDLVALGILVIGLIDAGLLGGTILNSAAGTETANETQVDAEKERCKKVKNDCIVHCNSTLPTPDFGFEFWNCVNKRMGAEGCR